MTNKEIAAEIAKLYAAYAEGEIIQIRCPSRGFIQCDEIPTIDIFNFKQYRVKPVQVIAWYRVGEMKNGSIFLSCSGVTEAHFNNHKDFSRWLDERKEYEVTP